uniref:Uncharacterized protein n=1 Tax=Romanomermis culicivorax TaxID=13658 RepID=A0A915KHN6_ROMCU
GSKHKRSIEAYGTRKALEGLTKQVKRKKQEAAIGGRRFLETDLLRAKEIAFCDETERNAIDTTLPNEREIFIPFGSAGGYRRSFSRKLHLSFPIESGFSGTAFQAVDDPFRSVRKGKCRAF